MAPRRTGTMTAAEGAATDRLARGEAVPGGPGACAGPSCAHGRPWHSRHGKRRCERCPCPGYVRYAA